MTLAPARVEPVTIGPTWARDEDGRFILPERTLGWDSIAWAREYLLQPDGVRAGSPWNFTNEQARFVLWWYAIDEAGEFTYRSGMLRRIKGWGKDPLGAVLCAIEFIGPCRFRGWELGPRGERRPIVRPVHSAWVQVAATSITQTRNTMVLFPAMFSKRAVSEYRLDVGKEIIYGNGSRSQIQAVTSSPTTLEGARSTFVLPSETQYWYEANNGHDMAAVIRRNVAKMGARALAISNAHNPGENSAAEQDWDTWQAIASGRSRATGFLYDSLEAPPEIDLADDESLLAGLTVARGDSVWVDPAREAEEVRDPRTAPSTSRRFYLNQISAAEDAWVTPQQWDACADREKLVLEGELVTLGFDGSKSDDWSALVGCRVDDGHLFPIQMWNPDDTDGEIPLAVVDAAVRRAFTTWDVVGFFSDYHPFEPYVDKWEQELADDLCVRSTGVHSIAWDMRGRTRESTQAAEALQEAIFERALTHAGDPGASQHVYNARRRPNQYGVSFGKEHRESERKVDWLAAAMLARKARQDYLVLPPNKQRRKHSGRASFI